MKDKKSGYYIYYETNQKLVGVNKKVENQIKMLNRYFDCQGVIISKEKANIARSMSWRMPLGSFGRNYEQVFDIVKCKPDFFYIRFVPVDRRFLNFIKSLRERFPASKILLEIPTYPYKGELLASISMLSFYFKDLYYRDRLKNYVDRIVTLTEDKYIFGIPTIRIMNGIVVEDIKMIGDQNVSGGGINLIAVACFQVHHGYERLIMGMKQYYEENIENRRQVYLHMVGDGSELEKYKKLVYQHKLEEYVIFYGQQGGEKLDEIYDRMDVALGSFGFYKIGLEKSSVLKVREYLSRGLPIVSACQEDAFDDGVHEFYLRIENNDSVVDIEQIVHFYTRLFSNGVSRLEMAENIRRFAREKVDMSVTMKPVIEYILEAGND